MSGNEIRKKYLAYMEERGHAIVPSSLLVPENDPTTLFTGSGMQPMVPYLMGKEHPKGIRVADSQKCFRAEDIEEVGDNRHTTFFEMLGNWSFGDYFKKEQLPWFYNFLVDEVGLDPERIYVTTFIGDEETGVPRDTESVAIWQELLEKRGVSTDVALVGSEEDGGKRGMKEGERIFYYDASKNWWSRAGKPENMPVGEIGGPDSEVFYDFGTDHDPAFGEQCHPNCDCGRFIEIGNSVFIEYIKKEDGSFEKLAQRNVDFGGGLERIAVAACGEPDIFKVDLLNNAIQKTEEISGKKYEDHTFPFRVIADHIRGAVFMIGDGVLPSNTEQGYFVRRLIRRAVRYADVLEVPSGALKDISVSVIDAFGETYPELTKKKEEIIAAITTEEERFRKTLEKGMREFEKQDAKVVLPTIKIDGQRNVEVEGGGGFQGIGAERAFKLFTTYGFPIELTEELAKERGKEVDREGFEKLMKEHREKSRAGAEDKFKGGLADNSEKVVQYHTATHLLLAGLRKELGDHVHQAGSNITGERLRFDFTHGEKVDRETLDRVEVYVNDAIEKSAMVSIETLKKEDAESDPTIEGSFWDRYPDEVHVYTIKDAEGTVYSRELCGGPHVENTNALSGTFSITKEESVAQGVRRVKAVLTE